MIEQTRVWFVTGTSSGLGNALVHELLKSGHSVVATARNVESLQEDLNKVYDSETLKRVVVTKLDVTQPPQVKDAFATGLRHFGRIDVVVNNAGYSVLGEVEAFPNEDARALFEVIFWGTVEVSKEAVRIFRDVNPVGEGGLIVNISSAGGYSAQPTLAYYNSAKFAMEGFTESLRKEMSPEWKIQATIVEPGGFNTAGGKGNMTMRPIHPKYASQGSPAIQYRALMGGISHIGITQRVAKALLNLAEKKAELPLRVQLGTDALTVVRHTAMKTISDSEKWEHVSHSTNMDGIDPQEFTKQILKYLQ